MGKKRLVKNYDALTPEILEDLKEKYPSGYEQHLIKYTDKEGKFVSALPFETDDAYYLIRMTIQEAKRYDSAEYEEDEVARPEMENLEVDNEFDGQGEEDDDLADGMDDEDDHIIVTRRRSDDDDDIPDDTEY